jgi:hypothetical protein
VTTLRRIDRDEIGEAFVNLTRVSLISSDRKSSQDNSVVRELKAMIDKECGKG